MKILLITQYYYPESFRINDFVQGLKDKQHQITVLTGLPNYPTGKFFPGYGYFKKYERIVDGISIVRVPLFPRRKARGINLMLNYISFAFSALILAPLKCRDNYDVIFVYMPSPITVGIPAIIMKHIKKAPIYIWVQDLWPETLTAINAVKSRKILNWVTKLVKYIYKNCDRIFVPSKGFKKSLLQHNVPQEKIYYLPNAAEDFYSQTSEMNIPIKNLPDGFKILYAGNIGEAQAFDTILKAALMLKDHNAIKWLIMGDGRQKSWLQEQINSLDLSNHIFLIDQQQPEDVPYYVNKVEALLISLRKDPIFSLTIPSKLQSYLACGKPILAAIDGEASEIIIEAQAGLVAPSENPELLAKNVLTLYHIDPSERAKMGQNGRQYFEANFARDKLLDQFDIWLKEIERYKQ